MSNVSTIVGAAPDTAALHIGSSRQILVSCYLACRLLNVRHFAEDEAQLAIQNPFCGNRLLMVVVVLTSIEIEKENDNDE